MSEQRVITDIVEGLEIVASLQQKTLLVDKIFAERSCRTIGFVNAHAVNLACANSHFQSALLGSSYLLRDGVGMEWLLRLGRRDPGLNMNGTDLIPELIREAISRGYAFCILGTQSPYNERAAGVVRAWGGEMALVMDGFSAISAYQQSLKALKHERMCIVLGMGMPKQELLSLALMADTDVLARDWLVLNGGAIIDFLGGKVVRAPLLLRRMKLEWLYRLVQEPRRMWRRYLLGNLIFLYRTFLYRLSLARRGA